jgi:hypothetical protein
MLHKSDTWCFHAINTKNVRPLISFGQDRAFALFLGCGTPHTQGILPLLEANKVPLIAPSTGAAIFHHPANRWLFNIRVKYQDGIIKAIEHFTTIGIKSIGLLHVDDAFGEDGLEGSNTGRRLASRGPQPDPRGFRTRTGIDAARRLRRINGHVRTE